MPILKFTVDSALLSELGEKLVESPHIALVELVKNAYDADATSVQVKIIPRSSTGPEIHVVDNGSGMTFRDVQAYWMRIATTHKVDEQLSPRYGRPRTGSKGIGRFSCRRLGTQLEMTTTSSGKGGFETTSISLNWQDFSPGKDVTEIECHGKRKNLKHADAGTQLLISGHQRDEWTKRGYDFLKRQLAVLVANRGSRRRGFEPDPGFNISLQAPGFDEEISDLREKLLGAGWGDIEIKVTKRGKATCRLRALRVGEKVVTYPQTMPRLAGVTARIGVMAIAREEMRNKEVLSMGNLRRIRDDWGGVYIRYRGFRVFPYGEPGTDWLSIDRDRGLRKGAVSTSLQPFAARLRGVDPKRALLGLLSSHNYIGDVEIGDSAKGFELKASREGFVSDESIGQLKDLVRFAIDWATLYRDLDKRIKTRDEAKAAVSALEAQLSAPIASSDLVDSAIRVVESEVRNVVSTLPVAQRQKAVRSIQKATDVIAKHDAVSRQELRHLQLVASTSTLLLIFSHEVKALMSWFEQVSIALGEIQKQLPKRQFDRLEKVRGEFQANKRRFLDLLGMTSLISVDSQQAKPVRLALVPRIVQAVRCFGLITKSYKIEIDYSEIPKVLKVGPMLEAELFAVLLNVLSNSIKSVIAAGRNRRIALSASREGNKVRLHVKDTGLGLREDAFEEVFEPFISDPDKRLYKELGKTLNPEDSYIVGTGSGLGLGIVREILAYRGGAAQFRKPRSPWRADLEISMP